MSKKLLKSTAVVSSMTMLSRISGLVRDIVMANLLGSGVMADAFFVAFRIPNFFRRLVGEGAFSQAFVPVFSELRADNDNDAKQFVSATAGKLSIVLLLLSVAGVAGAPWLVKLFAPGFIEHPEKFALTVDALRIMFPYLFFISLVAMSAGILNTLQRFAVPAATPILLNLCLILALLFILPMVDSATRALAFGVLIAGVVQLAFQIPSLVRTGYLTWPSFSSNRGTQKVFRLMVPAILGVSAAQVNALVNTLLASFLVTGSVSWLYYSDRLMEFPVAVFGIALATVVLPSLTREHQQGSESSFSNMLDWALRWVVMIATPAAVALALLAVPLLATIFQHGAFSASDVYNSALSLRAYSVGVIAFILIKVLAPGFYARQDTKTPMRIAVIAIACNIVMSLLFIGYLQHAGLALALALAAWFNAAMLAVRLWRCNIYRPQAGWLLFLGKIIVAVLVMTLVIRFLSLDDLFWLESGLFSRIVRLLIVVTGGALSYFLTLYLCGLRPHQLLLKK
ncbi:MAG: murein biosynthesis integral membrane protein MurJ [Arenicella sp.]